jgi:hypothetical protein
LAANTPVGAVAWLIADAKPGQVDDFTFQVKVKGLGPTGINIGGVGNQIFYTSITKTGTMAGNATFMPWINKVTVQP